MISHQTIMLDFLPPNDPNPAPATQRVRAAYRHGVLSLDPPPRFWGGV
jgi:hypothetical protein